MQLKQRRTACQPRSSLEAASQQPREEREARQQAGRQAGREAVARCGRCERWVGRTFGLSRGDKSPLKRQDLPGDRRLQLEKVRRFFPHLNSSSAEEPRQNQIAVETAFRGLHFPLLPSFRPGFEGGRGEEARSLGRSCCRREREREGDREASEHWSRGRRIWANFNSGQAGRPHSYDSLILWPEHTLLRSLPLQ